MADDAQKIKELREELEALNFAYKDQAKAAQQILVLQKELNQAEETDL